jgi:rhodanese-related sulfurtransferase
MRRIVFRLICWVGGSVLCACLAFPAQAISVAALQSDLAAGAKVTVIDLRPTSLYAKGHIPSAINIPSSLCPLKKMPPLGRVVVYDDGLGFDGAAELKNAAAALAKKPGLSVDTLSGGYAAWLSAQGLTTAGPGMRLETFHYMTYVQLQAADPAGVVLVDLRKLTKVILANSSHLTDLSREFPGRRVVASALEQAEGNAGVATVLVLIDSADGTAEATARLLKAKGVQHYAVLVGGELAIARKGQPGLERSGPRYGGTVQSQNPPLAAPTVP